MSEDEPEPVRPPPPPSTTSRSSFDSLLQSSSHNRHSSAGSSKASKPAAPAINLDGEECPSSAVELQVKEKVSYYTSKRISKENYKEILRKCVPKVIFNQ